VGRRGFWGLGALALSASLAESAALAGPAPAPPVPIATVELAKAFGARSPWRLVATQGPPTEDYGGDPAPGAIQLCLQKGAGPCALDLTPPQTASGPGWDPHYLSVAKPVYPKGAAAPPLLMIVTASLHAGDGGQLVVTQLFRYDRAADVFARVVAHSVGTNNNEEVRFVASGPLAGDVITAEPTEDAPYAYWIEIDALTPAYAYKPVLRYRSATRYGDGNPLAVIDSEMPNTLQRLGRWKPGAPLPLPAGACPNPHLVKTELWCK
jgi:hypothetical protein